MCVCESESEKASEREEERESIALPTKNYSRPIGISWPPLFFSHSRTTQRVMSAKGGNLRASEIEFSMSPPPPHPVANLSLPCRRPTPHSHPPRLIQAFAECGARVTPRRKRFQIGRL